MYNLRTNIKLPDFCQAINSFRGYPHFDKIPAALFQRIKLIMLLEKIQIEIACQNISEITGVSPEEVHSRLERAQISDGDRQEFLPPTSSY